MTKLTDCPGAESMIGKKKRIAYLENRVETAEARVEALTEQLGRTVVQLAGALGSRKDEMARAEAVEAQCAAMREALEQVEWEGGYAGDILTSAAWCPECGAERGDGHTASCSVGQALATDAGKEMLAEVRRFRERDQAIEDIWTRILENAKRHKSLHAGEATSD